MDKKEVKPEEKVEKRFKFLIKGWKTELLRYKYYILIALLFLIVANFTNTLAGNYVTYVAQVVEVPDLILDNIGPYDWSFSFVYISIILVYGLFLYPLIFYVKKFYQVLIQFSLLSMFRSFFIILTHLQTSADAIQIKFPGILNTFVFSNDLFFSGHTAFSFLGFLIFKDRKIKWFFLIGAIYMAITTLVTHRHYSIDVLAAFFIAYGSFKIGERIIKKVNSYERKKKE